MATSFDGLSFGIQTSDSVPLPERELIHGVRTVPYSDTTILDVSGLGTMRFRATIRITPANLTAWRARLGLTKTLILEDVSYTGSTLVVLSNVRRLPRNDYLWADAEWVVGP